MKRTDIPIVLSCCAFVFMVGLLVWSVEASNSMKSMKLQARVAYLEERNQSLETENSLLRSVEREARGYIRGWAKTHQDEEYPPAMSDMVQMVRVLDDWRYHAEGR